MIKEINFDQSTRFLVTGGAGFIGSNIIKTLLQDGYEVICLDDLSRGHLKNIEAYLDNPNFTFIQGDICDLETVLKAMDKVDYVLHQAAWGSVPRSIEEPLTYERINSLGTETIFWAAHKQGVKRVVYASSSSVYGDHPDLPKKEGREGRVLSPYALTKKTNELYSQLFGQLYGLESIGLRYFNVYGPNQDPNGAYAAVIPKFVTAALRDEALTVNGDGTYSRDFTYVDNAVRANLLACLAPKSACNKAYNIACDSQISLNDMIQWLENYFNKPLKVVYGPVRPGDIPHSFADTSAARENLGYVPCVHFDEGMAKAIDYYMSLESSR